MPASANHAITVATMGFRERPGAEPGLRRHWHTGGDVASPVQASVTRTVAEDPDRCPWHAMPAGLVAQQFRQLPVSFMVVRNW
jgi:hypothetical protein